MATLEIDSQTPKCISCGSERVELCKGEDIGFSSPDNDFWRCIDCEEEFCDEDLERLDEE